MYSLILTNVKLLPYNINNDTLNFVFKLMKDGNLSYLSNVSFSLYADYGNGSELVTTYTTNNYGISTILYPTNAIEDRTVKTALFWTTGTIGANEYTSNIVRVNFLEIAVPEPLIIDANLNLNVNRSNYTIYNANGNRSTSIRIVRP